MSTFRVFYLDDEPGLCELFTEYFDTGDVSVTTFTNARLAIEAVNNEPPMVIFIDYRLSDTDGEAVAKQLPRALPKVLISGDLEVNTTYPFEYRLSKPFRFEEVEEIIRELARLS